MSIFFLPEYAYISKILIENKADVSALHKDKDILEWLGERNFHFVTLTLQNDLYPVSIDDLASQNIGGQRAQIEQFNFQAAILTNNKRKPSCGGSIISATKILTTATCIFHNAPVKVRIGSEDPMNGGVIKTVNVIVHPKFHGEMYNVALLTLVEPLEFNSKIGQISLLDDGVVLPSGAKLTLSGYGITDETTYYRAPSKHLRSVELPLIDGKKCKKHHPNVVNEQKFCAGLDNSAKHIVAADVGGKRLFRIQHFSKCETC